MNGNVTLLSQSQITLREHQWLLMDLVYQHLGGYNSVQKRIHRFHRSN